MPRDSRVVLLGPEYIDCFSGGKQKRGGLHNVLRALPESDVKRVIHYPHTEIVDWETGYRTRFPHPFGSFRDLQEEDWLHVSYLDDLGPAYRLPLKPGRIKSCDLNLVGEVRLESLLTELASYNLVFMAEWQEKVLSPVPEPGQVFVIHGPERVTIIDQASYLSFSTYPFWDPAITNTVGAGDYFAGHVISYLLGKDIMVYITDACLFALEQTPKTLRKHNE